MLDNVQIRARQHGYLGSTLINTLKRYDYSQFLRLKLDGQMAWIYRPLWNNSQPSNLARAALSYLGAAFPIQVPFTDSDCDMLLSRVCSPYSLAPHTDIKKCYMEKKQIGKLFAFKESQQALTKANIFLDEVCRDVYHSFPHVYNRMTPYLEELSSRGCTNDQAASFVLYACALDAKTQYGIVWAYTAITSPDLGKEVSNFLKAMGANSLALGAMLVESNTLLGRGVGGLDLRAEAAARCDPRHIASTVANYPAEVLGAAIRRILSSELMHAEGGYKVDYPSLEDHWVSRWRWAVNGAHNRLIDREHGVETKLPGMVRVHRRAALEAYEHDPRIGWDGHTIVSASPKEEHGKTRAIFACDTVNYLAFQHLMGEVEKRWRGVRVCLDPGKGGNAGMASRIAKCRNRSGVSMMLDYDDFNSHHSTQAMQLLISITCEMTGYPSELAATLVKSFECEDVYTGGEYIGRVAGTLMSGHRCTTYINSVLNMAYLMCELGSDYVYDRVSVHVGDDVYFGVNSYVDAASVVQRISQSQLRMNRSKQSVGHISTEFLRMASRGGRSYGYLCRSIAATVSGNWVTDSILDPFESLQTMLAAARSLANRGQHDKLPLLLVSACKRTLKAEGLDDKKLRSILVGSVAVNDGPQYVSSGQHAWVNVVREQRELSPLASDTLPTWATRDYLLHRATELEQSTLSKAGISVRSQMISSSFAKSLDYELSRVASLRFSEVRHRPAVGSTTVTKVLESPHAQKGVLLRYPLLTLARSRLPNSVVREAVSAAGGNGLAADLEEEAWGARPHGCIVIGALSYSDAAALGRRTKCSVLRSEPDCFF